MNPWQEYGLGERRGLRIYIGQRNGSRAYVMMRDTVQRPLGTTVIIYRITSGDFAGQWRVSTDTLGTTVETRQQAMRIARLALELPRVVIDRACPLCGGSGYLSRDNGCHICDTSGIVPSDCYAAAVRDTREYRWYQDHRTQRPVHGSAVITRDGTYIRIAVKLLGTTLARAAAYQIRGQWVAANQGGFNSCKSAREAVKLASSLARGCALSELRQIGG